MIIFLDINSSKVVEENRSNRDADDEEEVRPGKMEGVERAEETNEDFSKGSSFEAQSTKKSDKQEFGDSVQQKLKNSQSTTKSSF